MVGGMDRRSDPMNYSYGFEYSDTLILHFYVLFKFYHFPPIRLCALVSTTLSRPG